MGIRKERRAARRPLVIAVLLILIPRLALPCTCLGPRGRAVLPDAKAVFSGKVAKVDYLEKDRRNREPKILVTFEVYRVWKGALGRNVVIRTIYNRWTCTGYFFKAGNEYLVTAYEQMAHDDKTQRLTELGGINTCGGTLPLGQAVKELEDLGPGGEPSE